MSNTNNHYKQKAQFGIDKQKKKTGENINRHEILTLNSNKASNKTEQNIQEEKFKKFNEILTHKPKALVIPIPKTINNNTNANFSISITYENSSKIQKLNEIISESKNKTFKSNIFGKSPEKKTESNFEQINFLPFSVEGNPQTSSIFKTGSNVAQSKNNERKIKTRITEKENEDDDKERIINNTVQENISNDESTSTARYALNSSAPIQRVMKKDTIEKVEAIRLLRAQDSIIRQQMREEMMKLITEGSKNSVALIDKLYSENPDRYLREPNDPNFIFNIPTKNGKNVFYIACQEGRYDIVEYFLSKDLNSHLKSKIGDKFFESPLACSSRRNDIEIVKLLLSQVSYSKREIQEALHVEGISGQVKAILKNVYRQKFGNSISCC